MRSFARLALVAALVVVVVVVDAKKPKRTRLQDMSYEQLQSCFPTRWSNGAWYDSHFPPAGADSDGGSLAMKRAIYNKPERKYEPSNTCALRLSWALSQCRTDKWQSRYTKKSLLNGGRRAAYCWDAPDLAHANDENRRKCEGGAIGRVRGLSKWMKNAAKVKMTRFDKSDKGDEKRRYSIICADEKDGDTCEPSDKTEGGRALLGARGIIVFENCGWDDATGHYDLWDGWSRRCEGHCQWVDCAHVRLFSMPSVAARAAEALSKKFESVKESLGWSFDQDDDDDDNDNDDADNADADFAQSAALDGSLLV